MRIDDLERDIAFFRDFYASCESWGGEGWKEAFSIARKDMERLLRTIEEMEV